MTLRDKIARIIAPLIFLRGDDVPKWVSGAQNSALHDADRILALLAESGWRHVPDDCVVVPREPTEEMVVAGSGRVYDSTGVYRAMLAAAPK